MFRAFWELLEKINSPKTFEEYEVDKIVIIKVNVTTMIHIFPYLETYKENYRDENGTPCAIVKERYVKPQDRGFTIYVNHNDDYDHTYNKEYYIDIAKNDPDYKNHMTAALKGFESKDYKIEYLVGNNNKIEKERVKRLRELRS